MMSPVRENTKATKKSTMLNAPCKTSPGNWTSCRERGGGEGSHLYLSVDNDAPQGTDEPRPLYSENTWQSYIQSCIESGACVVHEWCVCA